jgi:hypothetical protein
MIPQPAFIGSGTDPILFMLAGSEADYISMREHCS